MHTSKKNGLIKGLSMVIVLVLTAALLLTGCSDTVAQEAAKLADSKAAAAQSAADAAKEAAKLAGNAANENKDAIEDLKDTIAQLPTAEDVAEAIEKILNDYVKGDATLDEGSIITYDELVKFLQDEKFTEVLSKYALASALADYAKAEALADYAKADELDALAEDLEKALGEMEEDINTLLTDYFTKEAADELKTELEKQIADLEEKLAKADADNKAALEQQIADLEEKLAKADADNKAALEAKVDGVKADLTNTLNSKVTELTNKFNNYYTGADVQNKLDALKVYADSLINNYKDDYANATDAVVEAMAELAAARAMYAAAKADYTDAAYNTIVDILWEVEIRVMRAQTATEAEDLADEALKAADDIMTKAEESNKGAAFDARIVALLTENGYLANNTCLYSELNKINTLKAEIEAWFEEVGTLEAEKNVLVPNYDNLKGASTYATNMTTKYNEAIAEDGVIAILNAANALRAQLTLDDKAAVVDAAAALAKWEAGLTGAAYVVDDANVTAIIGANRLAAIQDCLDRIDTLEDAKDAAIAINNAIDALDGNIKITSMKDIRVIRNAIVAWLNTYNVVPATNEESPMSNWFWLVPAEGSADVALNVTGEYVIKNYGMINHAKLDELFNECDALLVEAITDAKKAGGVIELINAIDLTDARMLYQYANFEAARKAYAAWAKKFGVEVVNLATGIDFGTGDANAAKGVLLEAYLKFNEADTMIRAALTASAKSYADNKANYDAVNALTAVTVYDGALINAAYEAATEWYNTFLDERAFNDSIKSIEEVEILSETEYYNIVAAKAEYDALVAAAKAAGAELQAAVNATAVNVYNGDKLVELFYAYGAYIDTYEMYDFNADLDAELAFVEDIMIELNDKIWAYEVLMIELEADIADLTAKIDALIAADFTIYSRDAVAAARDAYNAFAAKAGLTDNTSAAYTDEIDEEFVLAFKAKVEKLEADEAALAIIELAKNTETATVIDLINKVNGVTITTAYADEIAAARAAYEAWLAGTNFEGIVKDAASYAIDGGRTEYVISNYDVLVQAEADLAVIEQELKEAIDAIDGLIYPVTNDTEADALEAAIEDAKKELDEYYAADGGVNNGGLDNEVLAKLAKAEMALALYRAKQNAYNNFPTAKQYYHFVTEADAQFATSCKDVDDVTDEELLGTTGKPMNTIVNLFKDQLAELYGDVLNNFYN